MWILFYVALPAAVVMAAGSWLPNGNQLGSESWTYHLLFKTIPQW